MFGLRRGIQSLGKGVAGYLRGDGAGALVVQDGGARFQEAVLNGRVFIAANAGGTSVTSQAGLSATTPALTIYNPANSNVNLSLWWVHMAAAVMPAGQVTMMLAYNAPSLVGVITGPTTVTQAPVTNAILGYGQTGTGTVVSNQAGCWAQAYAICTLSAAPIAVGYPFGSTGASAISGMNFEWRLDGGIIIPPGVAVSTQTLTNAVVGFKCAACWEEISIG